ncbi:MAG: hypothetical protein AAGG81_07875 [Chlamydiota bacterium]
MFDEQKEISRLEDYLKRFDENLFENRTDLATLRSECTERKEKLRREWTKFKDNTLCSSMLDLDLKEYYTNTNTVDSLA